MSGLYSFYCKRCGDARHFDTKLKRNDYRENHRPWDGKPRWSERLYACKLEPVTRKVRPTPYGRNSKGETVYLTEQTFWRRKL